MKKLFWPGKTTWAKVSPKGHCSTGNRGPWCTAAPAEALEAEEVLS